MPDETNQWTSAKSPHFFHRERDRSARFRIRLSPELASLIEEAAGETPIMWYIERVLRDRANYHIKQRQASHPTDVTTPDPEDDRSVS